MSILDDYSKIKDPEERKVFRLKYYARHLVGMAVVRRHGEGKPGVDIFSGFVITYRDEWFWMTAGHVIEKINSYHDHAEITVHKCELIDSWGIDATHRENIPFSYDRHSTLRLYTESLGIDYGLLRLAPMYRNLLSANSVEPIYERNWNPGEEVEIERYEMLGVPEEHCKPIDPASWMIPARPALVPVRKLDCPPEGYEKRLNRFVGKLPDDPKLTDIVGMSGGPIFAFGIAPDGDWRYWTVAIQSGWIAKHRITFACPISEFMDAFGEYIDET